MGTMVATGLDAPVKLGRVLEAGGQRRHAGRPALRERRRRDLLRSSAARPIHSSRALARQVECPIHGTRVVRLPDRHRFRVDLTEAIEPVREADGRVDIAGTMQAITSVIELGARAPRAMAVGAPPLAVSGALTAGLDPGHSRFITRLGFSESWALMVSRASPFIASSG